MTAPGAMVDASQTLKAVLLMETDVNGDILTWSFPALDTNVETVLKNRSGLQDAAAAAPAASAGDAAAAAASASSSLLACPFRFSKYGSQWLYQLSVPLDTAASRSRKVTGVSVGLVSSAYFPAKNHELLKLLLKAYQEGEPVHSPLPLMSIYLSVLTTNKFEGALGKFDEASFDNRRAMIAPLKHLIQLFGADSITIWSAMLLRKRIFVYHPSPAEVMNLVKIFPLLGAWHRQDVSILRPLVTLSSPVEMADLASAGVFVAGFTDEQCIAKKDLYDVHVDAVTKVISFGASAAASAAAAAAGTAGAVGATPGGERPAALALTKFHHTTSATFTRAAASETEQAVIKTVAQATKDFLAQVAQLKADDPAGAITPEGLAAAGLPQPMQTWIYNVAVAEGMAKK